MGDDVPLQYCADADGDTWCTESCGPECPGADHTGKRLKADCSQVGGPIDCADNDPDSSPGRIERCSAVDEDCDGNAYGSYPVPGSACTNGKQGSCYKTGGAVCSSFIMSGCDAGDWPDAPNNSYSEVALHGSYDRNCDGVLRRTKGVLAPVATGALPSGASCTSGQQWKSQCDTFRPSGSTLFFIYLACDTEPVSVINAGEDYLKVTTPSVPRISKCGSPYLLVTCNYNGNAYGGQQYNMQCN